MNVGYHVHISKYFYLHVHPLFLRLWFRIFRLKLKYWVPVEAGPYILVAWYCLVYLIHYALGVVAGNAATEMRQITSKTVFWWNCQKDSQLNDATKPHQPICQQSCLAREAELSQQESFSWTCLILGPGDEPQPFHSHGAFHLGVGVSGRLASTIGKLKARLAALERSARGWRCPLHSCVWGNSRCWKRGRTFRERFPERRGLDLGLHMIGDLVFTWLGI